jgi:hypothetical protein
VLVHRGQLDCDAGRFARGRAGEGNAVSLRGRMIEERAALPDGGEVLIRIGVLPDPYVPKKQLDTVTIELERAGEHIAAVTTMLSPEQESEALAMAREVKAGIEAGEVEPTAAGIETYADRIPAP